MKKLKWLAGQMFVPMCIAIGTVSLISVFFAYLDTNNEFPFVASTVENGEEVSITIKPNFMEDGVIKDAVLSVDSRTNAIVPDRQGKSVSYHYESEPDKRTLNLVYLDGTNAKWVLSYTLSDGKTETVTQDEYNSSTSFERNSVRAFKLLTSPNTVLLILFALIILTSVITLIKITSESIVESVYTLS